MKIEEETAVRHYIEDRTGPESLQMKRETHCNLSIKQVQEESNMSVVKYWIEPNLFQFYSQSRNEKLPFEPLATADDRYFAALNNAEERKEIDIQREEKEERRLPKELKVVKNFVLMVAEPQLNQPVELEGGSILVLEIDEMTAMRMMRKTDKVLSVKDIAHHPRL